MKLETTAGSLHSALVAAMPFVERRSTLPILGSVLIDNNKVIATDLDMVATIPVAATMAKGKMAVEHSRLMKILSFLPRDESVTLTGGAQGATLTFGLGRYELPHFVPSDFPANVAPGAIGVPMSAAGLSRALKFVSSFICTEETRYYLNGVCFNDDLVVATDGHCLGRVKTSFAVPGRPIVPRSAVHQIMRRQIDRMAFGEKSAEFVGPGIKIVTRLIDGTYPDFNRVIPAKEKSEAASVVTVKTSEFMGAFKRAGALNYYTSIGVSRFGDIAIYCQGSDLDAAAHEFLIAEAVSRVEAPMVSAMNAKLMLRVLANYKDAETLTFRITDPGAPIEVISNDDRYSLIMPMRGASDEVVSDLANHPAAEARRIAA